MQEVLGLKSSTFSQVAEGWLTSYETRQLVITHQEGFNTPVGLLLQPKESTCGNRCATVL
jgi:hypothetical protein